MELLHVGFDTLHVAFQGCLSEAVQEMFEDEKELAADAGEAVYANIKGLIGHVAANGAQGGYRWIFDQGPLEAKWLIKRSTNPNNWNLFAQIGSRALAENGLEKCIENLYVDLDMMGGKILSHAINRFDVCADVMSPGFIIEPQKILCHSHSTVSRHHDEMPDNQVSIIGGARISTLTVGKMPGRQVQIYDKRKEHKRSGKTHWWNIWGIEDDLTPIWRVEIRSGKKHNDDWNIRTFEDLTTIGGDLVLKALEDIRYLEKRDVQNIKRSKTHPIWDFVKSSIIEFMAPAIKGATRGKVREVMRDDLSRCMGAQMSGLALSVIALAMPDYEGFIERKGFDEFRERAADYIARQFHKFAPKEPLAFQSKLAKVGRKYHFIEDDGFQGEENFNSKNNYKFYQGEFA